MEKNPPKLSTINVMIIEDDVTYRQSLQAAISAGENLACPYACESCEEALEILEKDFAPEVLLLDIKLPGISGIEGIPKFKAFSPSTHIIMLTVFDDDDLIFNALCRGAEGYLLKSATPRQIYESIQNVLCGGAAMTPTIAGKVLKMFTQYAEPKGEYDLTTREKEILQLLVDGHSKKHLADRLCISLYTVDTHLKNIYAKLHVHSQIDVIAKALKEHLL
ncbi:MAG: response regulator transcription factor [Calditrichaeota bacterium]|nr:response regulator transcription factor [Calditrichota bacterium]